MADTGNRTAGSKLYTGNEIASVSESSVQIFLFPSLRYYKKLFLGKRHIVLSFNIELYITAQVLNVLGSRATNVLMSASLEIASVVMQT